MKQLFSPLAKGTLFTSFALAIALLFTSCAKDSASGYVSLTYTISGNASGSQAVPASSNSNGSGNMSGTYNSSTKVMTYTTTWSNLTGAPLSGGLYTGAVGQIGTSISAFSFGNGLSTSGSVSGSATLNADQEAQMLAGKSYFIMSTAANVSGEIRGQITASAQ